MDIKAEIARLKQERNAVILAHNYQIPSVQDIADYRGDSLGLSMEAAATEADVIVFCGVYFMAETAKILSPQKTVLIPDAMAGCPMADMISAAQLRQLKAEHPGAGSMCYVNSTAAVKAECDICCTSANAAEIAASYFPAEQEVIFVPDRNLAANVGEQLGRDFITWPGYCPTHERLLPEMVTAARERYPDAEILVHPECRPAVVALADRALSTGGMLRYAGESTATEFVIGTETGMCYRLEQENPAKSFHALSEIMICPNMKRTTLAKLHQALETMQPEVAVAPELAAPAETAIRRMLELSA